MSKKIWKAGTLLIGTTFAAMTVPGCDTLTGFLNQILGTVGLA